MLSFKMKSEVFPIADNYYFFSREKMRELGRGRRRKGGREKGRKEGRRKEVLFFQRSTMKIMGGSL